MFGINSKKKREEQLRNQAQAKKEQEIQSRLNIRKYFNNMKSSSAKLDSYIKDNIERAKQAKLTGDKKTLALAKSGLKMCLMRKEAIDNMIIQFEICMQLKDVNGTSISFMQGMQLLSQELKNSSNGFDIVKAQAAYEDALNASENTSEAVNAFLESANDSIEAMDCSQSTISDDEIDKLIDNGVLDAESDIDKEIDSKINEIEKKLQL